MYAQHKQNTGVLTNTSSLQAVLRSPRRLITKYASADLSVSRNRKKLTLPVHLYGKRVCRCFDFKLCANIGIKIVTHSMCHHFPLPLSHKHARTHTAVMDRLFILRRIGIHKAVSAPICLFTCCILWPNENKSIVPLGRDSSSLNHL